MGSRSGSRDAADLYVPRTHTHSQALTRKQLAAMVGAADPESPSLLTVANMALKNSVHGHRFETEAMLDFKEITLHRNASGWVDGYMQAVGQTKVDRLQVGETKAMQCTSNCTGKLQFTEEGAIDGDNACPVHLHCYVKELWEKKLGLDKLGLKVEEGVFGDYVLWADAPAGATVVAVAETKEKKSALLTTKWEPKHPIMIVERKDEVAGLRYRRGMKLSKLAADGKTLVDVTPNSKGMWFEIEGKPYLFRPWTSAGEACNRLRALAIIANKQARKAGLDTPFGDAFKVSQLKGKLGTRSLRRRMATGCVEGNVPMPIGMKQGGWTKEGTMLKYVEDTDPFATCGINLSDVILQGKKANEATDGVAMQRALEMHVKLLKHSEEEVEALRELLTQLGHAHLLGPRGNRMALIKRTSDRASDVQSTASTEVAARASARVATQLQAEQSSTPAVMPHVEQSYTSAAMSLAAATPPGRDAAEGMATAGKLAALPPSKKARKSATASRPCCTTASATRMDATVEEQIECMLNGGMMPNTPVPMQTALHNAGIHLRLDAVKVLTRKRSRRNGLTLMESTVAAMVAEDGEAAIEDEVALHLGLHVLMENEVPRLFQGQPAAAAIDGDNRSFARGGTAVEEAHTFAEAAFETSERVALAAAMAEAGCLSREEAAFAQELQHAARLSSATSSGTQRRRNAATSSASMHSTSVHLGLAADSVAQADYDMASASMSQSG